MYMRTAEQMGSFQVNSGSLSNRRKTTRKTKKKKKKSEMSVGSKWEVFVIVVVGVVVDDLCFKK